MGIRWGPDVESNRLCAQGQTYEHVLQGGGYLARQQTLPSPQAQLPAVEAPAAEPAGGMPACSSSSSSSSIGISGCEDAEEEDDPADARLAPHDCGNSRPLEHLGPTPAAAAVEAVVASVVCLACHIAYHPSHQVPVLYLEVGGRAGVVWKQTEDCCMPVCGCMAGASATRELQQQHAAARIFAAHLSPRPPQWPCKQATGRDGAPLALPALLAALPRLQEAVEGGQPYTVLTQEVGSSLRCGVVRCSHSAQLNYPQICQPCRPLRCGALLWGREAV